MTQGGWSQQASNGTPWWVLDEATIRRIVGDQALERGRIYAARGAVTLSPIGDVNDGAQPVIARVAGGASRPYSLVITRRTGLARASGSCSCPMRTNCKHVAAVLLEIAAKSRRSAPSAWEHSLAAINATTAPPSRDPVSDLAIQFELRTPGGPTPALRMRPVTLSKGGKWTRTGVSWSHARYMGYSRLRFREDQLNLLDEIVALGSAQPVGAGWGYAVQDQAIRLDLFASRRIWEMLAEAEALGMPLVNATPEQEPVTVSQEPAIVSLDVTAHASEWVMQPRIVIDGTLATVGAFALLGSPAHGIAWWLPDDLSDDGSVAHIRLAPLDRPIPVAMREMFGMQRALTVPTADHAKFLTGYYPTLRSRVNLTSSDESFDFPTTQARLHLRIEHLPPLGFRLEWAWDHVVGDSRARSPLLHDVDVDRDSRDDETRILGSVLPHAEAISDLVEETPSGVRLAPVARLSGIAAATFVEQVLPRLRELTDVDIEIEGQLPAFHEATAAPIITMGGSTAASGDWFDLAVTITIDGEGVPFEALFRALANNDTHAFLPTGTYFSVERPEFQKLRDLIVEARSIGDVRGDTIRLSRFQSSLWEELEELGIVSEQANAWAASLRRLQNISQIETIPPPPGLHAELRPYQQYGFEWLSFLYENRLGGILADDMGLGKTVQALALMVDVKRRDPDSAPFLVVAPTSVVSNWASECRRFCPDLDVAVITETGVRRRKVTLPEVCAGKDIVVTSYALFRIEFEEYERLPWAGLILDEAQAVKNHQSRGYLCARRLPTPFKLAITGTPMENNLMELWSMFSIATPGLFPRPDKFTEFFRTPIERDGDEEQLALLRRRIKPLLLRRTKEEVASELPEKIEQIIALDLNPRHQRVYQTHLQRERQKVLGLLGDMSKNRFEIFKSLTLLRQLAIDPALVDERHEGIPSTKLDALMEQVDDIVTEGHRALIFSQFTRFLGRVRDRLDTAGVEYCYLDGRTRKRAEVIDRFKEGSAPLFLISLKAGGVGLNLVEADYCIILDPWWNPATEAQAVDRTHRIGQTRNVMVYRLVSKETIEEKVMALKATKAALFRSVLADGGAGSSHLSAADIRSLLE